MTANEAVNELRSRACATGVAGWTWNYDVEHGTITLSLTVGKKHASRSVPSDKSSWMNTARLSPAAMARIW